ncbi:uncharacterized protein LOC127291419 [Leptopilina boulardi]|uniref:uncharacterized protein LOC127291419 n=1 Tax=Leptopilina boulardi TaxID=63433 RepID=UPI0021F66AEB|nr:uncharacterized protein LOC127291419 [Leptopilina boulardi]
MDFSSNEAVDAVEFWDKTVELIAFVQSKNEKRGEGKSQLLRFYLNTGKGRKIQSIIWGAEDIKALENVIVVNEILHIDGAFSRVPSKPEYNFGNFNYELQLFAKTVITSLGKHIIISDPHFDFPTVALSDVIHHEGETLRVHGYIKSKFVEERIGMHKNLGTYGCGSITDGTYKMEVRIASFKGTFKGLKGNPVNLIGNINTQGTRIFLQIKSEEDIEILEERSLSFQETIAGFRELKRTNDGQIHKKKDKDVAVNEEEEEE